MPSIEVSKSPQGVPGAVGDPTRISGEDITFAGAEQTPINGYIARPADAASHPGIVVIHEAGGLGEHIRDVANRLANIGYVALAVDLYTREGGPPDTSDVPAMMARLFSMSDATALGDLEGAADHLRGLDGVTGRIGCIGFCMGGRYTLLLACASEKLNAAVD
ncbi:MAG: dienelactone hydrolase family protein, partial [Solirubrobacteraceae bacterium]